MQLKMDTAIDILKRRIPNFQKNMICLVCSGCDHEGCCNGPFENSHCHIVNPLWTGKNFI